VSELAITGAFDVEIILRILAALPDWRAFFGFGGRGGGGVGLGMGKGSAAKTGGGAGPGQNWLDTALAVGCSVIQIPAVQRSAVYPWFTIFQLMRFYRVILVVPRMKPLLVRLFLYFLFPFHPPSPFLFPRCFHIRLSLFLRCADVVVSSSPSSVICTV
jgi:hypothetical protein